MFLSAKQCWSISGKNTPLVLSQQPHPNTFYVLDRWSSNCAWNCFDYNCLEL